MLSYLMQCVLNFVLVYKMEGLTSGTLIGEKGTGASTGKSLHYKGSIFHRIMKRFGAQVCHPVFRLQMFIELSPAGLSC